jgi:GlpG protein
MDLLPLLRRYPVTGGLCLLACVASFANWTDCNIDILVTDFQVWSGQIWRPLTSTLPHANPIHLVFNLYWLWRFGKQIERIYGPWLTAALYAYLGFGSSLAEYDFAAQGIGLSGVVYGLFGYVWIVERSDQRFWGIVDQQTIVMFVAWFFLCVILTAKEIWAVANFAHAGGLALGVLCGWAVTQRYFAKRPMLIGLASAAMALLIALGTVARPFVNFTEQAGHEYAYTGYKALENGRNEVAVKYFRLAIVRSSKGSYWYDLGIAYQRLGRWDDAANAYEHAYQLTPDDAETKKVLEYARWKAQNANAPSGKSASPYDSSDDGDSPDDAAKESPPPKATPRSSGS